jgi:hypothetical protein
MSKLNACLNNLAENYVGTPSVLQLEVVLNMIWVKNWDYNE